MQQIQQIYNRSNYLITWNLNDEIRNYTDHTVGLLGKNQNDTRESY